MNQLLSSADMNHAARGLQEPWLTDVMTSFLFLHDGLNVLGHVGVAPTVVVTRNSAVPGRPYHAPPRSTMLVDAPVPVCAVDSVAVFGSPLPASATIVAMSYLSPPGEAVLCS